MKRKLVMALCGTLALAMAVPAFAKDHKINGYYRARFIMADLSKAKDQDPDKLVDQRVRFKWTMSLNEYVSTVYYGEIDMQYGDVAYGIGGKTRNDGGAIGGDTVNLETKNLYLNVKIPDTPVAARLGLQGFGDSWDFVFFATDMAGLKLSAKFDTTSVTAGWFKWQEGSYNVEDDVDLWALKLGFAPADGFKLGVDGYYVNANAGSAGTSGIRLADSADLYYLGANATYKLPQVTLAGWFMYNGGTLKNIGSGGDDVDVAGWAASLKATFSVAGASFGVRGIYFSGDDDLTDDNYDSYYNPVPGEAFAFYSDGFIIMLADVYGNTYYQNGYAMDNGPTAGNGLMAFTLTGKYTPPTMKKMYIKGAFGYFTTLEGEDNYGREGDDLGTELAVRVGYKLAEIVDVSVNGAYAWLGDYFTVKGGDDPDDSYEVYAMVNVGF